MNDNEPNRGYNVPLPVNEVRDYWDGQREKLADKLEAARRIEVYATEDIGFTLSGIELELITAALRDNA